MQVLSAYYAFRRKVMLFCCGRTPRYSISYTFHGGDLEPYESTIPRGMIMFETVQRTIVDETDTRTRVYYPGSKIPHTTDAPSFFVEKADAPWMWIGGIDADGETHTFTGEMTQFLLPGNRITLALLWAKHPEIVTWKYMDATFEEIEFPVDGITI
jgi:hypothetical protein